MLLAKVVETEVIIDKEVGKLTEYIGNKIPGLIDFAIGVVLALVVFLIGTKVIKWIRKLI